MLFILITLLSTKFERHIISKPNYCFRYPGDSRIMSCELIITPITASVNKPARVDYEEQLNRITRGLPLMWDDSRHNKAKLGDKFGFWFYNNSVRIHTIVGIALPSERLPSWSGNVGQGDRRVVTLSVECDIIPWETWINLNGAKRCMGTSHVKKGLNEILYEIQ